MTFTAGHRAMVKSYVDAGKARILAVLRPERTNVFPGIATAAEQGYPSVITDFWVGFSGPQKLPPQVVQTWENDGERDRQRSCCAPGVG